MWTEKLPYNDRELLSRIAEGDEQAFTKLFVKYSRILQPFVYSIVKTAELTEEVIQQVFLKCWLKRDQLGDVTHPQAYIYRIASNECFAHLRKEALDRRHHKEIFYQHSGDEHALQENKTGLYELKDVVKAAYEQLSPRQQEIYSLSRHQQMNIPEIADHLQISPTTVKNTLVKSLKTIRTYLEKEGYTFPLLIVTYIFLGKEVL